MESVLAATGEKHVSPHLRFLRRHIRVSVRSPNRKARVPKEKDGPLMVVRGSHVVLYREQTDDAPAGLCRSLAIAHSHFWMRSACEDTTCSTVRTTWSRCLYGHNEPDPRATIALDMEEMERRRTLAWPYPFCFIDFG